MLLALVIHVKNEYVATLASEMPRPEGFGTFG